MSSNKKTNLSWRRFHAILGVFPYLVLVFHYAVSTLFLLLWWKSHNGRYLLLYFLSVYPPLAFVTAEQKDMLNVEGADAEPAESQHFLSNNLKSCGVNDRVEASRREGTRGSGIMSKRVSYAVWSAHAW